MVLLFAALSQGTRQTRYGLNANHSTIGCDYLSGTLDNCLAKGSGPNICTCLRGVGIDDYWKAKKASKALKCSCDNAFMKFVRAKFECCFGKIWDLCKDSTKLTDCE